MTTTCTPTCIATFLICHIFGKNMRPSTTSFKPATSLSSPATRGAKTVILLDYHDPDNYRTADYNDGDVSCGTGTSLKAALYNAFFSLLTAAFTPFANKRASLVVLAVDGREEAYTDDMQAHMQAQEVHVSVLADGIALLDPRALPTALARLRLALKVRARSHPHRAQAVGDSNEKDAAYALQLMRSAIDSAGTTREDMQLLVVTASPVATALQKMQELAGSSWGVDMRVCDTWKVRKSGGGVAGGARDEVMRAFAWSLTTKFVIRMAVTVDGDGAVRVDVGAGGGVEFAVCMQPRFVPYGRYANGAVFGGDGTNMTSVSCVTVCKLVRTSMVTEDVGHGVPEVVSGDAAFDSMVAMMRGTGLCLVGNATHGADSQDGQAPSWELTASTPVIVMPTLTKRMPEVAIMRPIAMQNFLLPVPEAVSESESKSDFLPPAPPSSAPLATTCPRAGAADRGEAKTAAATGAAVTDALPIDIAKAWAESALREGSLECVLPVMTTRKNSDQRQRGKEGHARRVRFDIAGETPSASRV